MQKLLIPNSVITNGPPRDGYQTGKTETMRKEYEIGRWGSFVRSLCKTFKDIVTRYPHRQR